MNTGNDLAAPPASPFVNAAPHPDAPPWNSLVAIGYWFASVLAIVVVPSVIVIPYIVLSAPEYSKTEAFNEFLRTDRTAIILQIIAIVPAHLLTLALGWAIVTKMRTFPFRETLGWRSGGMRWWHHAGILLAVFALAAVLTNYFPEQENELIRLLRSSRAAVWLVAFMATFTAPVVEEVVYRGVLYSALQRSIGVWPAVAMVTILFALVHLPQYYPSHSTMFLLLLLSLILTVVRVRTGNLLPCIVLHTVFNATQSVLLILEPYIKSVEPVVGETAAALVR